MTNASYEQILHLVDLIYDASTKPDLWPEFARDLCKAIPSTDFNIHALDLNSGRLQMSFTLLPPETMQLYFEQYHHINPYFHGGLPMLYSGRIARSHEICSPEQFEQTVFYQEYFRQLNLFHVIHTTVLKEGDITAHMSLSRAKERGVYVDEEAHLISLLVPHLQRAFRIGQVLESLRLERDLLSQALGKLPQGAIIVSRTGQVMFTNPSAEQILAPEDGLLINRQGSLEATSPSVQKRLRQMIETAGQPESVLPAQCGGLFQLERPSGLRPLSLLIAPLSLEISHYNFHQPSVVIFISNPEQQTEAVEDRLRQLYGLTPAEARLTIILMRGANIVESAAELQVSQNTARTHLKRIFQKTRTHRQSELVNLLLSSPVAIK